MTTEQIKNPKKVMGIVWRAVKPRDMTELTVEANGGANISLRALARYSYDSSFPLTCTSTPSSQCHPKSVDVEGRDPSRDCSNEDLHTCQHA